MRGEESALAVCIYNETIEEVFRRGQRERERERAIERESGELERKKMEEAARPIEQDTKTQGACSLHRV